MSSFVARQAILNPRQETIAYELLFRSGTENAFLGADPDAATRSVVKTAFLDLKIQELTSGKRAYINFTEKLILQDFAQIMPADQVVIEILETVQPLPEVVSAVSMLKQAGYTIAIDDYAKSEEHDVFFQFADIIKVDFMTLTLPEREVIAQKILSKKLIALAEKVETLEDFQHAQGCGYTLFQGYFFAKPQVLQFHEPSPGAIAAFKIIQTIFKPGFGLEEAEEIVKHDPVLTYELLKFVNSPRFLFRGTNTVMDALVLLGLKMVKNWLMIFSVKGAAVGKAEEALINAVVLGIFCEQLALQIPELKGRSGDLFLAGLFFSIDSLLDLPKEEAIRPLGLKEEIQNAILGKESPFADLLKAADAYRRGEWELASEQNPWKLDPETWDKTYRDSVKLADQLIRGG